MIFTVSWIVSLIVVTLISAYCSSKINHGANNNLIYCIMISLGLILSTMWILVSKYSTNLIRDSLIWDIVYVVPFILLLFYLGHGSAYELKHWIGIFLTVGVFVYWLIIR